MKAILIETFVQDFEQLEVREVPAPVPKDGEVLVDVKACGVNFVDLLYARGKHQNNKSLVTPPFILGYEFAGVISQSPASSPFKQGDRVFGTMQGSFAEQICVPVNLLFHIPENWTFLDAGGVAATAPVSYGALIERAQLRAGQTVLVHAAAGGLGLMAVQIAKAVGAKVIATAGSQEKRDVALRFGADAVVDYQKEGWSKVVLQATQGKGVDVVYDPVGMISESLRCCAQFAKLLIVGFAGTNNPKDIEKIAMNRVLLRQVQLIGYRFGATARSSSKESGATVRNTIKMMADGKIKPTVYDKRYGGLESVVPALYDLSSRRVWGKAMIDLEAAPRTTKM